MKENIRKFLCIIIVLINIVILLPDNTYAIDPDLANPDFSQNEHEGGGGLGADATEEEVSYWVRFLEELRANYYARVATIDEYTKKTEIECIYANGVVVGISRSEDGDSVYIKDYPASKLVTIDGEVVPSYSLFVNEHAIQSIRDSYTINNKTKSSNTCPPKIHYWIVAQGDGDDGKTYKGVYSFDWCYDKPYYCTDLSPTITSYLKDYGASTGGWYSPKKDDIKVIEVTGSSELKGAEFKKPEAKIPLIGERIYFVDALVDEAYSVNFKSYTNSEQAVTSSKYAQFLRKGSNAYAYLQVGNTVTSVDFADGVKDALTTAINNKKESNDDEIDVYICLKESYQSQDASRGDGLYKFSSVKHKVMKASNDENLTCGNNEDKYIMTSEICKVNVVLGGESFCDKYANTAKILSTIITLVQILVPALLIVLTGLDIGKIVLSGNLEEELPKKKTTIIIRGIVAISIFFMPTIMTLFLSLARDAGVNILNVDCLFNGGQNHSVDNCGQCQVDYRACQDTCGDDEACKNTCETEYNTCDKNHCTSSCTVVTDSEENEEE